MTILEQVRKCFEENGDQSVRELHDRLMVSKQSIHTALNKLMSEGVIVKFGRTPKTIYRLNPQKEYKSVPQIQMVEEQETILDEQFLLITELGEMKTGLSGFYDWTEKRNLPFEKTVNEFIKTKKKYDAYFNKEGLINGTEKLMNTTSFDQINLDEIYYLDFYAIERFGKTRLGTLLHYAKQGQNKFLMKMLVDEIRDKILKMIAKHQYDAVCFVPPTIKRETQIMKFIETHLRINLPKIQIQKLSGIIPVPQKSLSKIEERINNANSTFAISERVSYSNVLLIDDAVGSGATLNQIAKKLKDKKTAERVTGLAIVGSFKGFDVITDI